MKLACLDQCSQVRLWFTDAAWRFGGEAERGAFPAVKEFEGRLLWNGDDEPGHRLRSARALCIVRAGSVPGEQPGGDRFAAAGLVAHADKLNRQVGRWRVAVDTGRADLSDHPVAPHTASRSSSAVTALGLGPVPSGMAASDARTPNNDQCAHGYDPSP